MTTATAFIMTHEPDPSRVKENTALSIIALTITRSLGRRGIKVVRVHPNALDHSLKSRYVNAVEISPNQYDSENALSGFLEALDGKYPGPKVLIPASDDCSFYIANQYERLSKSYLILNPTKESMQKVRNKRLQYELANKVGVPIPETYFPESLNEVATLSDELTKYPYIIKPLEAQKWRLKKYKSVSKSRKAIVVNSKKELIEQFETIFELDKNLMIQEVIDGSDTNLLTFIGYCSHDKGLLGYCIRSKLRQNPIDFGYCTATFSCHNNTVEEQSKKLLSTISYTGIVGIEYKLDEGSGEYKLIEINTRPVNTTGISIGCGVDIPYIAYCDVAGLEVPPFEGWEDNVVWLRFIQDFFAARELVALGKLSYTGWLKSLRGKRVHAIYALDDFIPFWLFYYPTIMDLATKVIGKLPGLGKKAA